MADPVVSSNHPGIVRLGFQFLPPDAPGQRKAIRSTPVAFTIAGIPQVPVQSIFSASAFSQTGNERVTAATLLAPYSNCSTALPRVPNYGCFDTMQKRRGTLMGAPAQPLFLEPIGAGTFRPMLMHRPPKRRAPALHHSRRGLFVSTRTPRLLPVLRSRHYLPNPSILSIFATSNCWSKRMNCGLASRSANMTRRPSTGDAFFNWGN